MQTAILCSKQNLNIFSFIIFSTNLFSKLYKKILFMYLSSHVFKLFFKMYECSLSNCFTSFNILDIVLCPSMTSFVGSQFLLKTMKILFSCWKMTPLIIIILTYPKRVVQKYCSSNYFTDSQKYANYFEHPRTIFSY